jgi:Pyridoxal-dependent decarboxylase, pyridoxal binding domain
MPFQQMLLRRSQAEFSAEPELEPQEEALVRVGKSDAGDLFGAGEPVTTGVGMNIEAASRRGNSRMVFASKAFPCTAMYRLMASEGLGVGVAGAGELVMALAGGVDPALIVMHGNAKTPAELRMAVSAGVGLIVIDNTDDIDRLEDLVQSEQPVLVRVIPGVRPDTYEAVATGQAGSKFGLPIPAARAAIARLRHSDKLRLDGLHMHIGSQILSTQPYARRSRPSPGSATSPSTTWAEASGSATPIAMTRRAPRTGSRPWRPPRAGISRPARRSSSSPAGAWWPRSG